MDQNSLLDCLIAWVNTFNLNEKKKFKNFNDLNDGLLISKCLNNIDPEFFNHEWLNKIKSDVNDNWRLKLLNLKKILQSVTDYYSEVLNHSLSGFEMPNLNIIVDSSNNNQNEIDIELSHLLQLVLGCAVNCERKSEFIKNIMEMNEYTQHMLMTAIQELMSKDRSPVVKSSSNISLTLGSTDDDYGMQFRKALLELNRVNELKDDIDQKCKRLDKQVSELQDEKLALISEMEMLKERLQQEDNARIDPNNELNKHLKLQTKLDTMQEELYRLESEKEKFRIQFEAAKAEQEILLEKNVELKKIAQHAQNLKDEVDILKHTSDKVEKLESSIQAYKIKLEEMADLKTQMKQMEENNSKYLEKIIQLEEEAKKIATLKSQIEMYKKQIQELHEQVLNDEMKMKKLEYEYKSIEEINSNLRIEKQKLHNDFERLKETNEQLTINAQISGNTIQNSEVLSENSSDQDMTGLFSNIELFNIQTETKEKILRLYHENKILKTKQNEMNEERVILLQSQYDDEKQRSNDLQIKLNETSKMKIELECQLNDLKKKDNENNNQNAEAQSALLKLKEDMISDLKAKLTKFNSKHEDDNKKNETIIKQLQTDLEAISLKLNEVKELKEKDLQAKDKELADANEKYRIYLEKAKIVIKSLDPRNGQPSDNEVSFLKAQLADKDKIIKQLTKENEKIRMSREQEEHMIASAWYQLGANLNRRATDERITTIGNSFLAQQRHIPSALSSTSSCSSVINSTKRNMTDSPTTNYKLNNASLNVNVD